MTCSQVPDLHHSPKARREHCHRIRPAGSLGAISARSGLVTSTNRTCNDAAAFASSAVSSAENAENLAARGLAYSSAPNRM
jgi:hypothetical protein